MTGEEKAAKTSKAELASIIVNSNTDPEQPSEFLALLEDSKLNYNEPLQSHIGVLSKDSRYSSLGSTTARKAIYDKWRESQSEDSDAATKFIEFVRAKSKKNQLYLEFKRKYRTDPMYTTLALTDAERAKLFKAHHAS